MQRRDDLEESIWPRESLQQSVFNWLRDARYWLGFLVGRHGDTGDPELRCEDLEFVWYANRGIRVGIQAHSNNSIYFEFNLGMFSAYGRRPFEYRLSDDVSVRDSYTEIEELIEKFFPGMHRANTWTICEIAVSENCLGKRGVTSICREVDGKKICWECQELLETRRVKEFHGFVYLIGNKEKGIYKIGLSQQPRNRYKAFGTKLPFKLEILHQVGTDDMKKAERLLHTWFREKNMHGEWFELLESDVELICNLAAFENGTFIDSSGNEITGPSNTPSQDS